MEDEWTEEETIVLVELNGLTDTEFLKKENVPCKILGVDSEKPLLKLGTNVFSGEYKDMSGTCLIFDKHTDGDDDNLKNISFHSKTQKTLVMHRAFLTEKDAATSEGASSSNETVTEPSDTHQTQDQPMDNT